MSIIYNFPCPLCGVAHGTRNVYKQGENRKRVVEARANFWESPQSFEPGHPFGVIQQSLGRGLITTLRHIAPNEDPTGSFPLIKSRLLAVITEWVEKGWLDKEELSGMVDVINQGPPIPPPATAEFKLERRPVKERETFYPSYVGGEEIPPTARRKPARVKKVPELLGPELPKPKVEKPAPKAKRSAVPPPPAEEPVKRKRKEFKAPFILSKLADGRIYYQDTEGKFVPPGQWKEYSDIERQPGPEAMGLAEYEDYVRTRLRPSEEAAQEAFKVEKARKEAEAKAARAAFREQLQAEAEAKKQAAATKKKGRRTVEEPGTPEEPPDLEVTANVAPGTLLSIIPPGKDAISLHEAFIALQKAQVLHGGTLTPEEVAAEEARFRDILTQELAAGQIRGGAGPRGNLPENRRLRSGMVTGFIMRPDI